MVDNKTVEMEEYEENESQYRLTQEDIQTLRFNQIQMFEEDIQDLKRTIHQLKEIKQKSEAT